jgi:hypothetical protein
MNKTNADAIQSLRSFALAHPEVDNTVEFAHLCTAAIGSSENPPEKWAVERVESVMRQISLANAAETWREHADRSLDIIRATDTSRPDGAIARSFKL